MKANRTIDSLKKKLSNVNDLLKTERKKTDLMQQENFKNNKFQMVR